MGRGERIVVQEPDGDLCIKWRVCGSYGPIILFTLSGVLPAVVEDIWQMP